MPCPTSWNQDKAPGGRGRYYSHSCVCAGGIVNHVIVFAEPLNIVGIVGTIVSLLLLGVAIISGLMLYYSPVLCWKRKDFWGPLASLSGSLQGCGWGKEAPVMLPSEVPFCRLLPWVQMCNNEAPKYHSRAPCHLSCWVSFLIVLSFVDVRSIKNFCEGEVDVIWY